MNSIPLLITAAFCIPAGIVIGLCIARLLLHRQLRRQAHESYMEAVRYYQAQQLQGRM